MLMHNSAILPSASVVLPRNTKISSSKKLAAAFSTSHSPTRSLTLAKVFVSKKKHSGRNAFATFLQKLNALGNCGANNNTNATKFIKSHLPGGKTGAASTVPTKSQLVGPRNKPPWPKLSASCVSAKNFKNVNNNGVNKSPKTSELSSCKSKSGWRSHAR